MKAFCINYNGVLDGVIERLRANGELTDNYHKADCFLIWQDVRGDLAQFAHIVKTQLKKPVYVIQHGRGATRDYCPPNNFPLRADKILVWGESEKNRLLKVGVHKDRIEVVGCPLFKRLKPKTKRDGINILYAPVISSKEEPENLLIHAELKKWEANKLQQNIRENFDRLKSGWATENTTIKGDKVWKKEIVPTIPRGILYQKGLVNVKLSTVHDLYQYQSPLVVTPQNGASHIDSVVDLLSNTDVLVCLEEGTMQLMACALDIPVVVVDIFKYGNYGGVKNYDTVEKIKTPAATWIKDLNLLGAAIDNALEKPSTLRKSRIAICEDEGGAHLGDAERNIIECLKSS